ncbi:MAG: 2-hydroxyacyl-CoA dehydratase, partial [Candidatus Tectomicrobia bacterium]|nr:2-hydroxyacyl-CoA dehydratase [Candidatus Tectomicrobia bacterium]
MKIEKVVKSFQKRVDHLRTNCPPGEQSKLLYNEVLKTYFEEAMNARQDGKLLGWASMTAPVELLRAMGVVPFKPEQYVIQNLASGEGLEYIEMGAGYGFNRESCSTHVALVGLAKQGLMPVPDFAYHSANPCDSGITLWDVLSHIYQCPSFFLDYPYHHDAEAVSYLKGELEDLVQFMEERVHRPMDPERLNQTVKTCHEVSHLTIDFQELRKAVPCPVGGRHALNLGITQNASGMPQTVEFVRAFYQETAEKARRGEGAIPQERHRILWLGGMPYYDYRLIDWMEEEFGAVIVADGLNIWPHEKVLLDPSDPLGTLARIMVYS